MPSRDRYPDVIADFQALYPYPFDPFQVEAMQTLARGASVLVAAPTGTGKTVIAEFGVHLARRAADYGRAPSRAMYTTPIKALSNQKYRDFKTVYGDDVGLLTGDVVLNPDAGVLIMTTEVLRNMVVQRGQRLDDVGVIVFDEVHYVGDRERGTAWEEAILLAPPGVPLVCLSATVPNVEEVAAWLRAAHGDLECIVHAERAVPLEHRYFLENRAQLVVDANGRRRRSFRGVGGELVGRERRGGYGRSTESALARPQPQSWEVVRYLEAQRLTPAIYFLFSRRACEEAAEACLALPMVEGGQELASTARSRLAELPQQDRALRQVMLLLRLLPRGVAVHHAGLLPVIKMLVEELFAAGRLRAVFATDTLALGINMPARTVVVGEMTKWDGEQHRLLTPNEYRQMTGRAGRRGIDLRGVSTIMYSPWVSFERTMEVVEGELLPLESAFAPHYSTAANLWHGPADRALLADLYARSLRRFQQDSQLEVLSREYQALEDAFNQRASGQPGDRDAWRLGRELGRVERELQLSRRAAAAEARSLVDGLGEVLSRHGYLHGDRPAARASLLRQIFDTNALTLAELLVGGALDRLSATELAELTSWFAYDREGALRSLPLDRGLARLHGEVLSLNARLVAEERRLGLSISRPLNEDFRGLILAWAQGTTLGEIAGRGRVAEGDLVGVIQKTLDLLGQLRNAVVQSPVEALPTRGDLAGRLLEADGLLRRGVVEASYRWAISGPPTGVDDTAEDEDQAWPTTSPFEHRQSRREAQQAAPNRAQRRARASRQRSSAAAGSAGRSNAPMARKPRRPARTGPPSGRRGKKH